MHSTPLNLTIDFGNTRLKVGLFRNNELIKVEIYKSINDFLNSAMFRNPNIVGCIISSVVDEIDELINYLNNLCKVIVFSNQTPIPLINLYQSINTLGSDRLAAAIGGNHLFPNKNLLVVDAGTCLKYNFVTSRNEFLGGAISPGLKMRFKALNHFTARLPLVETNLLHSSLIGTTTYESIWSGVQFGIIAELEEVINSYKKTYPDLTVVFTGGDVNFFEKRFKNHIFANPNLILQGLNTILDFNCKGN